MKAKSKALNDAFNAGKEAMNAKQFDVAVTQFSKASEMAPDQSVIWANLGDAEISLAKTQDRRRARRCPEQGVGRVSRRRWS